MSVLEIKGHLKRQTTTGQTIMQAFNQHSIYVITVITGQGLKKKYHIHIIALSILFSQMYRELDYTKKFRYISYYGRTMVSHDGSCGQRLHRHLDIFVNGNQIRAHHKFLERISGKRNHAKQTGHDRHELCHGQRIFGISMRSAIQFKPATIVYMLTTILNCRTQRQVNLSYLATNCVENQNCNSKISQL